MQKSLQFIQQISNLYNTNMKSGMLKHPYLGQTRTYILNQRQMMENKVNLSKNPVWFQKYQQYKSFEWQHCMYPESVCDSENYQFNDSKEKQKQYKKISYCGYFVTTLRDQILTRAKNHAKFGENQILYVTYTIAKAWREWKSFCSKYNYENNFNAISSQHILLNQQGDIKLITPLSSPLDLPSVMYYAPENIPPTIQNTNSWNKSIIFSLGIISAQMISRGLASSFYQFKGSNIKFVYDQYEKWVKLSQMDTQKQTLNLILLMTDKNPWVRLKLGQFQALLFPYQKDILEGKQQNLNMQLSKKSLLKYLANKKSS